MHILLTGVTGYIAQRLLPALLSKSCRVTCCVRDLDRFNDSYHNHPNLSAIVVDFLNDSIELPHDIDAAFYFIHSMSKPTVDFHALEATCAQNFKVAVENTQAKQVIYLSGIVNEANLSPHLKSRLHVESLLQSDQYALTTLRAGIIVGSGSASFDIIHDLVEKIPIMITPRWIQTRCQPIAIRDVIMCLHRSLLNPKTYNQSFDIGGPDILSYKRMMLQFADVRGLKRYIFTTPLLSPRLSSYWLNFVTRTTYSLAQRLVDSMKTEVICRDTRLFELLDITPMTYREAIKSAFHRIEQNDVVSSWTDSPHHYFLEKGIAYYTRVPTHACFIDHRAVSVKNPKASLEKLWQLGGKSGWYFGNALWRIRGVIDQIVGGVGLRRGRRSPTDLKPGDSLDFWRVLIADKTQHRLLLYAEMKLPGEAWLEFHIQGNTLTQTATFRPLGLFGRLYWYSCLPFHHFIFNGLIHSIAKCSQMPPTPTVANRKLIQSVADSEHPM
ncbi:SDR family oxidoreductase [Candidatus Marinamargulisbacteria bacterium]|nr:epimerase [bacterium]MDA7563987.1 SDR family oxidoreductase [Candidatus Marinamargulisbacteria bacterium]MDG2265192.1 SDR family oxidoreductase [Candidatus Marinamargulisbacteria bacterium]|tara:strand:- start:2427 stop:3917 length:1491 start_codon:yes stop_codon:yes gene_type:complete